MVKFPSKVTPPYSRETLNESINKVGAPVNAQTVGTLNHGSASGSYSSASVQTAGTTAPAFGTAPAPSSPVNAPQSGYVAPATASTPAFSAGTSNTGSSRTTALPLPPLANTITKGQKYALEAERKLLSIKTNIGWSCRNPQCDVDVSAFLLGDNGKVLGDDWFVFYGQPKSPDSSVDFKVDVKGCRESVNINLTALNPAVSKIVFVLTINEALEKHLNFSMLYDAYIRVMNGADSTEIVSFKMDDYYENVTSMMIGELYKHNGSWKFNAIGNGVARDLAGLCELYGVATE